MAIYGVTFNGSSSAGTRTDDAVGMVWQRSTNTVAGQDDFASVAPFNVRECVTKYNSSTGKREVLGYKGDTGYSTLRSNIANDIMIEFPLFWYQRPSKLAWRVSDKPIVGFKPSPMHYHKGKLYKYVRVSKYGLNSSYISQSGQTPATGVVMGTFRTNLRSRGMFLLDYATIASLQMLMFVKYKNFDAQSTVGAGFCDAGASVVTSGGTNNVLGMDGSATTVSANESVLTMLIENLYSNQWKFIDGIVIYNYEVYIKDIQDVINNPSQADLASYTKLTTPLPAGTGSTISNIVYDSNYPYLNYPTATGNTSVYGGDKLWTNSELRMVLFGGDSFQVSGDGLFAFAAHEAYSTTDVHFGAMSIEFSDPIPQTQLYIKDNNEVYAMMQPQ